MGCVENHLSVVLILTIGFILASLLSYVAQHFKLPAVLGYLVAGFIIGPYSPGFVADVSIAEQLAEVGVVLMLFGVGLHFKLENLINVKNIAIPGAIGQVLISALVSMGIVSLLGQSLQTGLIIGLAIGVASTVVLVRLLNEKRVLDTVQGHIAVGWLVVEDIFTVVILILLPVAAAFSDGEKLSFLRVLGTIGFVGIKLLVLALFMFTWGQKGVSFVLTKIAHVRSREMLTLTVLALVFLIAVGSSAFFGASIALGAFIAGMVIGKTSVRYQAAANSLPLKDVFTIIFFISIGMLFNPVIVWNYLSLFLVVLFVVLFVKPVVAYFISFLFGYPLKVSLTVAVSLAQIGEFSFILAEEAMNLHLLSEAVFDILIACSLISISLNPLLFECLNFFEKRLMRFSIFKRPHPKPLRIIRGKRAFQEKILIVGFGPLGKKIATLFKAAHYTPSIVEENITTVTESEKHDLIIYGDAADVDILKDAHIDQSNHLFITIANLEKTLEIIRSARQLDPSISIIARIQHLSEKKLMEELQVECICAEEELLEAFTAFIYKRMY